MSLSILSEQIISLSQAARELPSLRNNRPVAAPTIWRWTRHGVKAGDKMIKLETTWLAGRAVTSREAVKRFLEECAAGRSGMPIPERTQRHGPAVISVDDSCRALDAAGV